MGLVRTACGRDTEHVIDLVLDDTAEAGAVYERRAGAQSPIEFVRGSAARCDAVVLGLDLGASGASIEEALDGLAGGCAVYAVCACPGCAADEALPRFAALERACGKRGLDWRGGLAIGAAQAVTAFEHLPRLGFWRRPVSEGTDRLLLALRCGMPAGAIAARQGPLRRAFAALLLRLRHR